jgi:hypothetical protein
MKPKGKEPKGKVSHDSADLLKPEAEGKGVTRFGRPPLLGD